MNARRPVEGISNTIPPALARLQHMNQDVITGRNALTPVLKRDDAMREWERRQTGKAADVEPYPQLEYRSTDNRMDTIPPALARLQHMNQDVITGRNALTPVLKRDDVMREWERRQADKAAVVEPYPQLGYRGTGNQMDIIPPALQRMNQDVPFGGRNALTPVLNRDDAMREWERRKTGEVAVAQLYPQLEYRSTGNQMDTIPPALARLQHMNQDVIAGRNALTPVLNRDDAMREWERRQAGKAAINGSATAENRELLPPPKIEASKGGT